MTNYPDHKAFITEIERFAIHDGPGIRTLVFIKGCPLKCLWCCNPESKHANVLLAYSVSKCTQCKACIEVCPENALQMIENKIVIDRQKCTLCGKCVDECPAEALELIGQEMSAQEVVDIVARDRVFYEKSSGGITLSGGEALAHPEFAAEVLRLCKSSNINTAVETCGFVPWESFEAVIPNLDVALFDIKHTNSLSHKQGTGAPNNLILENLKKLDETGIPITIRVPLIPGFNDSEENIIEVANIYLSLKNATRIDILPYHRLGTPKYAQIGEPYTLSNVIPPDKSKLNSIKEMIESFNIEVNIGG
jgi:pyruvate formate lyase activating enzyme